MHFDWYQATIPASHDAVLPVLLENLGDSLEDQPALAKKYRGERCYSVLDEQGERAASIVYGGQYGEERVHAWASSDAAPAFAELVRFHWPKHLVTRVDSAEDFYDAAARKRIRTEMRRFAKDRGLHYEERAKPLDPTLGETFYVGSPKSEVRVRGYDKGFEVFHSVKGRLGKMVKTSGKLPQSFFVDAVTSREDWPKLDGSPVDPAAWFRVEIQARPKDAWIRLLASSLTPDEAWALGGWTGDFARSVFSFGLQKAFLRKRRENSDEVKLEWMCAQYSGPLLRLMEKVSSTGRDVGAVGEYLLEMIRTQGRLDS